MENVLRLVNAKECRCRSGNGTSYCLTTLSLRLRPETSRSSWVAQSAHLRSTPVTSRGGHANSKDPDRFQTKRIRLSAFCRDIRGNKKTAQKLSIRNNARPRKAGPVDGFAIHASRVQIGEGPEPCEVAGRFWWPAAIAEMSDAGVDIECWFINVAL